MALRKILSLSLIFLATISSSCLKYSFTGASIPDGVNSIYIPFFTDQSNSGFGDLSDRLNQALIERFVDQSRLQLANSEQDADAILDGSIIAYSNRPFSIGGNEQANQNQIRINVRGSFKYKTEENPLWNKSFEGNFTFDPTDDPINGEEEAANEALEQIANNMFNDAVSNW